MWRAYLLEGSYSESQRICPRKPCWRVFYTIDKGLIVGHGINIMVLGVDPIERSCKGIDFALHML